MAERHYRRWTPADDRKLRLLWGSDALAKVAEALGRTEITTYWRGRKLGLPCGATQGTEYLTAAAKRTGFNAGQLRRILKAGGVHVQRATSRPTGAERTYHVVDPVEVDDAVAKWCGEETVEEAARRHGVSGEVVRRALLSAGHKPPKAKKKRWRVKAEKIDAAMTAYRPGFSVRAHAARVGLSRQTLAKMLRAAGVLEAKRPGVEVRLLPEVVDRVLQPRAA